MRSARFGETDLDLLLAQAGGGKGPAMATSESVPESPSLVLDTEIHSSDNCSELLFDLIQNRITYV